MPVLVPALELVLGGELRELVVLRKRRGLRTLRLWQLVCGEALWLWSLDSLEPGGLIWGLRWSVCCAVGVKIVFGVELNVYGSIDTGAYILRHKYELGSPYKIASLFSQLQNADQNV